MSADSPTYHQSRGTRTHSIRLSLDSPRSGDTAAPVNNTLGSSPRPPRRRPSTERAGIGELSASPSFQNDSLPSARQQSTSDHGSNSFTRRRAHSNGAGGMIMAHSGGSVGSPESRRNMSSPIPQSPRSRARRSPTDASVAMARARARTAQKKNDSMVYLDGPQVYTCAQCRTHLTSHDDIISKSFHGRHGRAYLFDQCVNVSLDPCENRRLITGLHSVSDIRCKRCELVVGWTYLKAYESSQKYKEGKFIIEKINLHLEESDYYNVGPPAGERSDRWRRRSISWGSEPSGLNAPPSPRTDLIYEYRPRSSSMSSVPNSPRLLGDSRSPNGTSYGSPSLERRSSESSSEGPPLPPF